jgi:D-alanyl-D-alanine carboxypeptidase
VLTQWDSYSDWARTLLDTIYRLPSWYGPSDLVSTASAGINGGYYVRGFVIADLAQMAAAARDAGAAIGVVSAYRSYWTQASTFNSWVSETGYEDALLVSARPGHSEHQLGTTLDLTSAGGPDPWDIDFGNTAAGRWLRENAWRYGFVMSYPYGPSPSITCYGYEPWHFRYFGRELAAAMHESGQTSREYLWYHGSAMTTPPSSTVTATPKPSRLVAAGDRPARRASPAPTQPPAAPEPSTDPTPHHQIPDEAPDLLLPAWLIERGWLAQGRAVGGAASAGEGRAAGFQPPRGEGDNGASEAATPTAGDSVLVGQLGVVAGLMIVLAVDSRTRRRLVS